MVKCDACEKTFHVECEDVDVELPFWHCDDCKTIDDPTTDLALLEMLVYRDGVAVFRRHG